MTRGGHAGRRLGFAALTAVPVAVVAVFFVLPVCAMLERGLWPEGRFDPGAVVDVLRRPRTGRVLWFTVWSSTVATTVAVALGLPAAYVLHRLRFPGRTEVRAALPGYWWRAGRCGCRSCSRPSSSAWRCAS